MIRAVIFASNVFGNGKKSYEDEIFYVLNRKEMTEALL